MATGLSPKLPLQITPTDGAYGLNKTYRELVKQNMKNLILTNPGERIMDPTFGVGLHGFLFELDTSITRGKIIESVQQQAKKYLPFVSVQEIFFRSVADDPSVVDQNYLGMTIRYAILPLDEVVEQNFVSISEVDE
jgi:hypothetical protein